MRKNRFKKALNNRMSVVEALSEAQAITFAPLTFQAIGSMLDLGILEFLALNSAPKEEIMSKLNLNEYTVHTLLQIAEIAGIVNLDNETYSITPKGEAFLYDDMTITNFNFVRDVCYLGASELTDSFKNSKPKGLQKFVRNSETIYPLLPFLPEKMKKSWYEFDHLYSDNCFEQIFEIITQKHSSICDIGGNTGKFEMVCFKHNVDFDITMFDLPENIKEAKKNPKLINCKFHSINVLDDNAAYPSINNGAVLMSQFLDCFSKEQIIKILKDINKAIDIQTHIYILEPFVDNQKYNAAGYFLKHVSLYFTCMANGKSKMYTKKEMLEVLEKANFELTNIYEGIGAFDYTLLECKKGEMASN
ncbi:MAG: hypothetical protein LUE64_06355 [Candidatus Gastranaerophilales bacterium]|nr:hypothetical protein [Candidatus Gastranaerophilales bacterium]